MLRGISSGGYPRQDALPAEGAEDEPGSAGPHLERDGAAVTRDGGYSQLSTRRLNILGPMQFWDRCTLALVELRGESDGESDGESRKYWVSMLGDITAERQAMIRAEKSEARYQALVDSFPNGAILLFDASLTFTLAGGEALRRAGFDPRQMTGRSLLHVLLEEYADRVRDRDVVARIGHAF